MSLFRREPLARAIDIKDRCYEFLKLFKEDKFKLTGKPRLIRTRRAKKRLESLYAHSHVPLQTDELSDFRSLKNIVLSYYLDLPEGARPATTNGRDVDGFCNFFLSYLFSSFDYDTKPKPRLIASASECRCFECARLTTAPDLKPKKVTNWDKRQANVLQREGLRDLASSAGVSLTDKQEEELLIKESLVEPLALVAYGIELLRRCAGERTDPSALVLWRRFAWNKSGSPKTGFVLDVDMILDAEKLIESRIRKLGIANAV